MTNDDNRSRAASSLRIFFDDQINHLQSLWDSLSNHIGSQADFNEQDRQIIENFVDSANNKMRAVNGYADKLREHVQLLYQHVLQIAAEIPPPIDLNADRFATTPLVNAVFVNSHEIDRLFQSDPEMKAYLRDHTENQVPVVYALLNARKSEKSLLGVGMLGDVLVRDVPQQAVNFSAHKVHIPCANSMELGEALKHYLFERAVALVKQEMSARMANQAIGLVKSSFSSHVNSLANPDVYLKTLLEYIECPEKLLSIDKTHFRLNKLGIKLENGDRQCGNEFDIHELIWSDNTRSVVLQIVYRR